MKPIHVIVTGMLFGTITYDIPFSLCVTYHQYYQVFRVLVLGDSATLSPWDDVHILLQSASAECRGIQWPSQANPKTWNVSYDPNAKLLFELYIYAYNNHESSYPY